MILNDMVPTKITMPLEIRTMIPLFTTNKLQPKVKYNKRRRKTRNWSVFDWAYKKLFGFQQLENEQLSENNLES